MEWVLVAVLSCKGLPASVFIEPEKYINKRECIEAKRLLYDLKGMMVEDASCLRSRGELNDQR